MAYRKATILHPIFGSIAKQPNGYWRVWRKPWRGYFLHRAVWERLAGHKLPPGWEVHHIDHDKSNNQPYNLIAMPPELHKAFMGNAMQHPYTGRFISRGHYERVMGIKFPSHAPIHPVNMPMDKGDLF
jgi:hypothetical protein